MVLVLLYHSGDDEGDAGHTHCNQCQEGAVTEPGHTHHQHSKREAECSTEERGCRGDNIPHQWNPVNCITRLINTIPSPLAPHTYTLIPGTTHTPHPWHHTHIPSPKMTKILVITLNPMNNTSHPTALKIHVTLLLWVCSLANTSCRVWSRDSVQSPAPVFRLIIHTHANIERTVVEKAIPTCAPYPDNKMTTTYCLYNNSCFLHTCVC